jgi:hypothetical protein
LLLKGLLLRIVFLIKLKSDKKIVGQIQEKKKQCDFSWFTIQEEFSTKEKNFLLKKKQKNM